MLTIAIKAEKVQKQVLQEELFVLMTNETDTTKLKDEDILKKYKEQITVETRFRWLKDPTVVDGIYLKTPSRVMALGYVFLIGLLIYCLLERRVRQNLARESSPLRLQGNRRTKKPTEAAFVQLFTDIVVCKVTRKNRIRRELPERFQSPELKRCLALAGFGIESTLPRLDYPRQYWSLKATPIMVPKFINGGRRG